MCTHFCNTSLKTYIFGNAPAFARALACFTLCTWPPPASSAEQEGQRDRRARAHRDAPKQGRGFGSASQRLFGVVLIDSWRQRFPQSIPEQVPE